MVCEYRMPEFRPRSYGLASRNALDIVRTSVLQFDVAFRVFIRVFDRVFLFLC